MQWNISTTPTIVHLYKKIITTPTLANTTFSGITNTTPFDKTIIGTKYERIPALITLNNGWLLSANDARFVSTADSPANIDTIVSLSKDNGSTWNYKMINYFGDEANTTSTKASASFIDSALVTTNNKVIMLTDMLPAYVGLMSGNKMGNNSTGFDSKGRLLLSFGTVNTDASLLASDYIYYVDPTSLNLSVNGDKKLLHPIRQESDNTYIGYLVDDNYNLYYETEDAIFPALTKQIGSTKYIQNNVFYYASEWKVYPCFYIMEKEATITDDGLVWSNPKLLNVKLSSSHSLVLHQDKELLLIIIIISELFLHSMIMQKELNMLVQFILMMVV